MSLKRWVRINIKEDTQKSKLFIISKIEKKSAKVVNDFKELVLSNEDDPTKM